MPDAQHDSLKLAGIPARGTDPVPRRRWRIAVLLGFGVLVNYFDRINLSVAQDALHAEFGISVVTFGYLLSAYSWTYALFQLPSGVLLDRFGVRRIGRISSFIWSVASFGAAAATGIGAFFGARFALGVGEAPTFPANAKAIGYWFPERERSLATAIFDAAAKFSSAIGVPVVGLMLLHFGWRFSFAFTGLISLVYFALFFLVYRNPSEDRCLSEAEHRFILEGGAQPEGLAHNSGGGASIAYLASQRKVIGLSIGFAAYNYTFYLLLTWLPSYLSRELHIDLLHSVLFTSLPWLFATFTDLLVGGWLVDAMIRRGHDASRVRQSLLVAGTALGLCIFGAARAHSATAAIIWITVALGGLAAAAPVAWSVPSLIAPRNSVGRVSGIMNFASQFAAIIAPIATGYIVSATGSFQSAFAAAAFFLVLGIAGYVFLLGRMEPIPDSS
jgi:sugar phosphate permease